MLFSLGSILSGTSQSMAQLIAMRTIQGLGAGAVGPIVLTMLGDLFTLKERAQVQGLFSAVWGLSSVGGPLIGGYLADHLGWQWVFLVCVPFALAAIVMLVFFVAEPKVERKVAPIDWAGAVLLTSGMSTLLWVVLDGSHQGLVTDLVALGVSAVLLVLFVFRERMAADPDPADGPDDPADDRGLAGGQLSGRRDPVWAGYIRAAVCARSAGGDATWAGRALMPLFLAWAVSVAVAARAVVHFGFRRGGMIGSALVAVGNLILVGGATFPGVVATLVHRRAGCLRPGHGTDLAQLRPGRAACREPGASAESRPGR